MKKVKAVFIILLVLTLAACSSSKNGGSVSENQKGSVAISIAPSNAYETGVAFEQESYDSYDSDVGMAVNGAAASYDTYTGYAEETAFSGSGSAGATGVENAKLIMTADVSIETENFDGAVVNIRNLVMHYNGYTSGSNMYQYTVMDGVGRRYTATLKIPAENYKYAFDNIKSMEGLKNAYERQENVTEQYMNTESRLATRKIEEERLLNLIAKTSEINELLNLERRLSQVRTDISLYESQIKNIDRLVAYSTINVNIIESGAITTKHEQGFLDRLTEGFNDSIRWLLNTAQAVSFAVAASALPLAVFAVLVFISFIILKKIFVRIIRGKSESRTTK